MIRSIRPVPLRVALSEPFVVATARLDRVDNVAVRVELDDGTVGWGELPTLHPITAETYDAAWAGVLAAAGALVGAAPDAQQLADELRALGLHGATRAGVEQAWWDADARAAGLPLFRRVRPERAAPEPVVTDVTIPICTTDRAGELAAAYRVAGFQTLKIKVGGGFDGDLARLEAVVGAHPEAALVLDANEGWSVDEALAAVAAVRRRGGRVEMLEQPVPRADLDGLARLSREAGCLVAADEACRTVEQVEQIGRERLATAVNVKIAKSGVAEALAMIAAARRHGLATMIGAMVETRLGTGFSAHVVAALGGFAVIDLDTSLLLAADPILGGPRLTGPRWWIDPAASGHGARPHPPPAEGA